MQVSPPLPVQPQVWPGRGPACPPPAFPPRSQLAPWVRGSGLAGPHPGWAPPTASLGPEISIVQAPTTVHQWHFTVLPSGLEEKWNRFAASLTGLLVSSATILPVGQWFLGLPPPGNEGGFPPVGSPAFSGWAACCWPGVRAATSSDCGAKTSHQCSHCWLPAGHPGVDFPPESLRAVYLSPLPLRRSWLPESSRLAVLSASWTRGPACRVSVPLSPFEWIPTRESDFLPQ